MLRTIINFRPPMNARPETLASARPNEAMTIVAIDGEPNLRRRMLEFGFVPGAVVVLRTTSTFGDPLDVVVRHGRVSLRRRSARPPPSWASRWAMPPPGAMAARMPAPSRPPSPFDGPR